MALAVQLDKRGKSGSYLESVLATCAVVLFAALITYSVGRVIWVIKNRGGMPQLPTRADDEDL